MSKKGKEMDSVIDNSIILIMVDIIEKLTLANTQHVILIISGM
jgi:hypothetical protein